MHDVLAVLERLSPLAEVLVSPCLVQGEGAPASIGGALDRLAGRVDVAILARGGGSVEDLWAFNDERVARAIARFPVPVVSAVGHEVDVTIADFVADVRAATPSAAAELVTPDVAEVRELVAAAHANLDARMRGAVVAHRAQLSNLGERLRPGAVAGRVRDARQRLDVVGSALDREVERFHVGVRERLGAI